MLPRVSANYPGSQGSFEAEDVTENSSETSAKQLCVEARTCGNSNCGQIEHIVGPHSNQATLCCQQALEEPP